MIYVRLWVKKRLWCNIINIKPLLRLSTSLLKRKNSEKTSNVRHLLWMRTYDIMFCYSVKTSSTLHVFHALIVLFSIVTIGCDNIKRPHVVSCYLRKIGKFNNFYFIWKCQTHAMTHTHIKEKKSEFTIIFDFTGIWNKSEQFCFIFL